MMIKHKNSASLLAFPREYFLTNITLITTVCRNTKVYFIPLQSVSYKINDILFIYLFVYLFVCLSVYTVTTIWKRDKSFSVVTVVTAKMCYLRKEHATGAAP